MSAVSCGHEEPWAPMLADSCYPVGGWEEREIERGRDREMGEGYLAGESNLHNYCMCSIVCIQYTISVVTKTVCC